MLGEKNEHEAPFKKSPLFFTNVLFILHKFTCLLHTFCVFRFPPALTMMHLCISQCTYWTPLAPGFEPGASNYLLYTANIPAIFSKHSSAGHIYADDVQAFVHHQISSLLLAVLMHSFETYTSGCLPIRRSLSGLELANN